MFEFKIFKNKLLATFALAAWVVTADSVFAPILFTPVKAESTMQLLIPLHASTTAGSGTISSANAGWKEFGSESRELIPESVANNDVSEDNKAP